MSPTTFCLPSHYDAPVPIDIFAAILPGIFSILHEVLTIYLIVACLHAYLLSHRMTRNSDKAKSASKIIIALIRIH